MGRTKGAKNKKTLEREQEQAKLTSESIPAPVAAEALPVSVAPPLVVSAHDFVEYKAPGGARWRVERGKQLCEAFEIAEKDGLAAWHECLAPETRAWRILRLHYGISPLVGEDSLEYLKPQSLSVIGEELGLTDQQVQAEIDAARAFWVRWHTLHAGRKEAAPSVKIPNGDERKILLERHGFDDLNGPEASESERIYVTSRISDLEDQLDDEEGRPMARNAIRMEMQLAMFDKMIGNLSREMAKIIDAQPSSKDQDRLQSLVKARKELNAEYNGTMEKLNLTQAQTSSIRSKLRNADALGTMIKAMQDYYAKGDNTLVDGIFTAAEIKIAITPLSIRPPQYRPDLVAIVNDAMKPYNLWDPSYMPPTFDRLAYRRFMKAWQKSLTESADADGSTVQVVESENEVGENDEESGSKGMPDIAPVPSSHIPVPPPVMGRSRSQGDDFVSN